MNPTLRTLIGALALTATLPVAATAEERYGYVRTLDGGATIEPAGESSQAAETNQPLLTGDRVEVSSRARIELELSDRNLVRLDGGSDFTLVRSAFSADGQARSTLLRLDGGDLQLVVTEETLGDDLPRIDTANATLYVGGPGLYRVTTDGDEWTEVTVRSGSLEVRTATDSAELREGDSVRVEGAEFPSLAEFSAPAEDELELWGRALDGEVAQADLRYVEPEMRYTTASLGRHGSWVDVGSRWAWRPRSVNASWRPYWDGRWSYTPSGLTWVSNEPWGWATYHYGSWDYVPGYGWVWYPGTQYSPAWVYWYWGTSYTAWCPSGYYSRYYGSRGWNGLRFGVYGWAGGGWDGFLDWSFLPTRYFGRRDQRDYCYSGRHFRDRYGLHEVPRGIITTDTRRITPDRWGRPQDVIDVLRRVPFDTRPGGHEIGDLPDVSAFVNRRGDTDPKVRNRISGLPPVTDVAVARRIPGDGGDAARRVPPSGGLTTTVAPRYEPPRGASGPRAVVPREGGDSPRVDDGRGWRNTAKPQPRPDEPRLRVLVPREGGSGPGTPRTVDERKPSPRNGGPTVERSDSPRRVVPQRPQSLPSPRNVEPDEGRPGLKPTLTPRRLPPAEPAAEPRDRQGWRDGRTATQPRAYVPSERGRVAQPPVARAPQDGGVSSPRRIYARPGSREQPTEAPVVRRVIDGVRSNSPRPTPYVSPAPRYQPQPERGRTAPPPSARGSDSRRPEASSARSRGQDAPRDTRGNARPRTEERKPPKRDH